MFRANGPLCWLSNIIRKLVLDRFVSGLSVAFAAVAFLCFGRQVGRTARALFAAVCVLTWTS